MFRSLVRNCSSLSCRKPKTSDDSTPEEDSGFKLETITKQTESTQNYKEIFRIQELISNKSKYDDNINSDGKSPAKMVFNKRIKRVSVDEDSNSSNENFNIDLNSNQDSLVPNIVKKKSSPKKDQESSEDSYLTYWNFLADRLVGQPDIQRDQFFEGKFQRFKREERDVLVPRISNSEIKFIKNEQILQGGYGCVRKGKIVKIDFKYFKDKFYFRVKKCYVAVKSMEYEKHSAIGLKTFINEVAILKSCQHPNVLKYMGVVVRMENFYLITEWCDGVDFLKYIYSNNGKLWKEAGFVELLDICIDVAKGMEYIHSKEILHRDIKSPNILLFSNKQGPKKWTAKLADFGLGFSRLHGFQKYNSSKLALNLQVGTPRWMAPEIQAAQSNSSIYRYNIERYSELSDVYSFGMVIAEVLSGEQPFYKMDNRLIATLMKDAKLHLLEILVRSDAPEQLVDLLWKCTEKKRNLRPEAPAIRMEIEAILDGLKKDPIRSMQKFDGKMVAFWRHGKNKIDQQSPKPYRNRP